MSKRRFVLIAAVSEYLHKEMPLLPGVRRDAERLRSTLENYADGGVYRMFWLPDGEARKQDIVNTLREITAQAGATDQVVVYFGGHGWRERDTSGKHWQYYLIPYDATFVSAAICGLATDELRKILNTLRAQELVVILDCCHSGGMANFHLTNNTLDELLEGWRSHYVMAASRGREEVGEDDSGGFFMKALCNALQGEGVTTDEEGRISAQKAWSYAADLAKAEAARHGHEQVAVSAGINSSIYLTRIPTVLKSQAVEIEITIDRDFESYTEANQDRFLRAIREFLKMDSDLKIKKKRRGSVKITLELSLEQAEKLFRALKLGQFKQYGVVDAELKAPREVMESTNFASDSLHKLAWYAIQTRSRHEKVVCDQLDAKHIIHWLPLWRKRSVWKKWKVVEVPLFGGYLFGYFALQDKVAVLETVGVARIVGLHGEPVPVPDEQIAAVSTMVEHRLSYDPHPYLAEGMRIRIKRGVLAGAEGILIAKKQKLRLVIGIDIIQQAVAVDIDSADVEPLAFPIHRTTHVPSIS